jgi:RNA polymerase sigma-70 factor (ECF subfamily)
LQPKIPCNAQPAATTPFLVECPVVLHNAGVGSDAERAVCDKYAVRIRGYGLRHLRDAAAADDLVQHVLIAVLTALREGRVQDSSRLDAYVLGTCRNSVMDMRRGEVRQRRVAERAAAGSPEGYEPGWAAVDRGRLEHCLRSLEPRDRAVVLATFVEDRDADEIGQAMKLSTGNVRVIRHRALARLLDCVERTPA